MVLNFDMRVFSEKMNNFLNVDNGWQLWTVNNEFFLQTGVIHDVYCLLQTVEVFLKMMMEVNPHNRWR